MEDRTLDRISRSLAGATSRRQALKLLGGGIAAGALGTVGLSQVATAQAGGLNIPFTTTLASTVSSLQLTGFQNVGGALTAVGNVLNAAGQTIGTFTAGAAPTQASCQILNLTLGPIRLDLLGLVVDIPNEIVVNITAVPGDGKLLGNLLCAVAGLLDGPNVLGAAAGLLNRILGLGAFSVA